MLVERRNIKKITFIRALSTSDSTLLKFKNADPKVGHNIILNAAKILDADKTHLIDLEISDEAAVTEMLKKPFIPKYGIKFHTLGSHLFRTFE